MKLRACFLDTYNHFKKNFQQNFDVKLKGLLLVLRYIDSQYYNKYVLNFSKKCLKALKCDTKSKKSINLQQKGDSLGVFNFVTVHH